MHSADYSRYYLKLIIMAILSFMAMYVLMYAMVDRPTNVYNSVNQFYMAGLMTMPMVVIELLIMNHMYQNKRNNLLIILVSIGITTLLFLFIRNQTAVSDEQFLRSMIPHHAGAILMCEQAPLQDNQIKELCDTIISSQQSEIDWMKNKLDSL